MSGRDIQIRLSYGDLMLLVNTEAGYQPDVVDDLFRRGLAGFKEMYETVRDDFDDTDDDETADTEGTTTDG